jgi:hypothetical protein
VQVQPLKLRRSLAAGQQATYSSLFDVLLALIGGQVMCRLVLIALEEQVS